MSAADSSPVPAAAAAGAAGGAGESSRVRDVGAHTAVDAVWRVESARVIAGLVRITGDVGLAEEFAQDALVAALQQWPTDGVPRNPGAWLMTTAKRRAIDLFRRNQRLAQKQAEIGRELQVDYSPDLDTGDDDTIADDLLRLVFTACHPVLTKQARVAMTLRLLGGLRTDEIARAFLVSESTIAQRIVRAKSSLTRSRVPFEAPRGSELAARLPSVLEVIYLVFNEGYSATAGGDLMRPSLILEAIRLGRLLVGLVPGEPEVHGLVALMEIQASRSAARTGPDGTPVLLMNQNRALWDLDLIRTGLAHLERINELDGAGGNYALQAGIAACHARATRAQDTNWALIASLYDRLSRVTPSPVVDLNRAVAVSMAFGPAAGLQLVDALREVPELAGYHLLPSVRGDLLERLNRYPEAQAEFGLAASLTRNAREQSLLKDRARVCADLAARRR